MKKEQISEALSFIDDDMLEQTNKLRMAPRPKKAKPYITVIKYTSYVAAAALLLIVGSTVVNNVRGGKMMKAEDSSPYATYATPSLSSEYSKGTANQAPLATQAPMAVYSIGEEDYLDGSFDTNGLYAYENDSEDFTNGEEPSVGSSYGKEEGKVADIAKKGEGIVFIDGIENMEALLSQSVITEQTEVVYKLLEETDDTVSFLVTNNMSVAIVCDIEWTVEAHIDDAWYINETRTTDTSNKVAFDEIKPGESRSFCYFKSLFGTLPQGEYRIVQRFNLVKKKPDDDEYIVLGFNFEIK